MNQPIEAIKIAQRSLSNLKSTREGLERVAGHTRRAQKSFWAGIKQPFLLSEQAATRLTAVESALQAVQVALDRARVQLLVDVDFHNRQIKDATPAAQVALDTFNAERADGII